jgi:N-acetylmuramoyl-L-alanine amidase
LNVTYVTETSPGPGRVQLTVGQATQYGVPELVNGTTMVPARFVEELGVTFEFDPQTKTATYKYGDNTVSVTNNRSTAIVNGTQVLMTEQAYINQQGRFMVPLRMVGEELGFTVTWVSNTQPITISK